MRQIKFRGKRKDTGEWVYGDLQLGDGDHIPMIGEVVCGHDPYYVQVEEDTIGQFTGLYDKNGSPIYEGDIVKLRVLDDTIGDVWKEYICEVSSCNGCFCTDGTPLIKGKWKGYDTVDVEICGNIHDTTELLNDK